MSFLQLPVGIPNFSKAVISLWFRVPLQSMQDAWTSFLAESAPRSRLSGVVPLLTFGQKFDGYKVETSPGPESFYSDTHWYTPGGSWVVFKTETLAYNTGSVMTKGESFGVNPSYIGIAVTTDENDAVQGYLKVFLRTANHGFPGNVSVLSRLAIGARNTGSPTGSALGIDLENHFRYGFSVCSIESVAPGNPWTVHSTAEDVSDMDLQKDGPDAFEASSNFLVEPDIWHHVLLSFDLDHHTSATGILTKDDYGDCPGRGLLPVRTQTDCSCTDPCKLWAAFDDKNYTGSDLTGSNLTTLSGIPLLGPNDIISRNSIRTIQSPHGEIKDISWDVSGSVNDYHASDGSAATYSLESVELPTQDHPFGIPASADLVDKVHHIEMAEFQMWTDITLDTGMETNRRAFVDYERDENGNINYDTEGKKTLKPVKPAVAEELLGKKPEILLHGSSKWIAGKNTGTTGVEYNFDPPETKPLGQFDPIGEIRKYKPDPSLKKDSGS